MGDYKFAQEPDDPVLLHLSKVAVTGESGVSAREQAAAGRRYLTA